MGTNNIQKIHATVSLVVAMIIVGMCILRFHNLGTDGLPLIFASIIIGSALVAFLNLYKGLDTFKKYLVGYTVCALIAILFKTNGFNVQYHYLLMCALSIVVLYFDKQFFRNFSLSLIPVTLFFGTTMPEAMIGTADDPATLYACYITFAVICMILYLLTKW